MLLQYPVQFDLFSHGRLNPEVPLDAAGDCGANTLFLLGLIDLPEATALSTIQNKCWSERHVRMGTEGTPLYLFQTYLFTDHSKQYEIIGCYKEDLIKEVKVLQHGYGTFIFMTNTDSELGHCICVFNDEDIQLADLQTEEIIKNDHEPDRLDTYLSQYDLFYVAHVLETPKRRESPIMYRDSPRSPSKPAMEESALMYSHASPAKHPESPARSASPARHARPAELTYRTPEKVASPLTPPRKKKRGGTRRKRTRRKN